MKRATLILLCALLGISLLAGCTKKEAAPTQPDSNSIAESEAASTTPESIAEPAQSRDENDGKPPVEVDENAEEIVPRPEGEQTYMDDGGALAGVAGDTVTSEDFGFSIDYPEGWAYLSAAEAGVQGRYIFGATSWESGSTLYIYQPLDSAGSTLKDYAEIAAVSLAGAVDTYAALGFTSQLEEPVQTSLGGKTAWLVRFTADNGEVSLTQCIYVAESSSGFVLLSYTVNTEADKAVAEGVVKSFTWQ